MQVGVEGLCRTDTFCLLQSTDREHRRSTGKQGMDASGNLYQYDNYDEVAMDTDSEAGSPSKGWACSQLSSSRSASKLCTLLTYQCRHPRMPSCLLTMLDVSRGTLEWYVSLSTLLNMQPPQWALFSLCHFCPSGLLSDVPVHRSSPTSAYPASTRPFGRSSQTSLC